MSVSCEELLERNFELIRNESRLVGNLELHTSLVRLALLHKLPTRSHADFDETSV